MFKSKSSNILLVILVAIAIDSSQSSADVAYDFFNNLQQVITGTFFFDCNVASPNSSWSVAPGTSLISIVAGGHNGIIGDFGNGFVPAVSGDLVILTTFGSLDGSLLDFGSIGDGGNGPLVFADGSTISDYFFSSATPDIVRVGGVGDVPGEFFRSSAIPEPAGCCLVGVAFFALATRRIRRNKR